MHLAEDCYVDNDYYHHYHAMIIMICDDADDVDKPKEDFCIAEDGIVESFVTWDLGFASQEALQRKKVVDQYDQCE